MMTDWFLPQIESFVNDRTEQSEFGIFMHDDAAPHSTKRTLKLLYSQFPFVLSRNGRESDLIWPPYSPCKYILLTNIDVITRIIFSFIFGLNAIITGLK